jgi:aminoglycoside phosphotransferase (APT) family kinase protein
MPIPQCLQEVLSGWVAHDFPLAWVEGFARMAHALGSGESPSEVRRLTGGLEAQTFYFRLANDLFVVKIYADDQNQAVVEFENLEAVSVATVATPEPVLIDGKGVWLHAPAIVMTALPGRPDMHPRNRQVWIRDAAEALASIHRIPTSRIVHVRTPRWQRWRPPTEGMGSDSSLADLLLTRLHQHAERLPTVVSHDDYNPGNLLFENGNLSGVVDWADISVEPRQAAVALFRHFLAIDPGGDAPEMFLDSYQQAAKTTLDELPLWDVLYGMRGVRQALNHWVLAFRGLGLDISSEEIRDRSRVWVRSAMSLAGG